MLQDETLLGAYQVIYFKTLTADTDTGSQKTQDKYCF